MRAEAKQSQLQKTTDPKIEREQRLYVAAMSMVAMNEKNSSDATATRFATVYETVIASAYCPRHEAAPQWTSECGHGHLKRVSGCAGPAAHSRMPPGTSGWGRSMEPDMGRYGSDPRETPTAGLQPCVSSLCCPCAQVRLSSYGLERRCDGGLGRSCCSRELFLEAWLLLGDQGVEMCGATVRLVGESVSENVFYGTAIVETDVHGQNGSAPTWSSISSTSPRTFLPVTGQLTDCHVACQGEERSTHVLRRLAADKEMGIPLVSRERRKG